MSLYALQTIAFLSVLTFFTSVMSLNTPSVLTTPAHNVFAGLAVVVFLAAPLPDPALAVVVFLAPHRASAVFNNRFTSSDLHANLMPASFTLSMSLYALQTIAFLSVLTFFTSVMPLKPPSVLRAPAHNVLAGLAVVVFLAAPLPDPPILPSPHSCLAIPIASFKSCDLHIIILFIMPLSMAM